MKAVLVILALLGVLAFTVILGTLAGLFLAASDVAENVNKEPENVNKVNKVNEKPEDAKTGDFGEM